MRLSTHSWPHCIHRRFSESSEEFSTTLVEGLLERMNEITLPHLTPNEHQSLYVLIQTTLQVSHSRPAMHNCSHVASIQIHEQRRALDPNGLRYLTMMRIFYNNNRRLSLPNTPASHGAKTLLAQRRQRLRYRDMVWAFHSESQDLLLSASVDACDGGKMTWPDARAVGVFLWLRSVDTMVRIFRNYAPFSNSSNTIAAYTHGSHRSESVPVRRTAGSHGLQYFLLRVG